MQVCTAAPHGRVRTRCCPTLSCLVRFVQVCSAIPCGKVSTYGALAKALRSSPRAVGQACWRSLPLISPFCPS